MTKRYSVSGHIDGQEIETVIIAAASAQEAEDQMTGMLENQVSDNGDEGREVYIDTVVEIDPIITLSENVFELPEGANEPPNETPDPKEFVSPFLARVSNEDLVAKILAKFNRKVKEDAISRDDRLQNLQEELEEGEITQEQYDAAVAEAPKVMTFGEQLAQGILENFPECSVEGCACIHHGDYTQLTFELEYPDGEHEEDTYEQTITAKQLATILPGMYLMFLAGGLRITSGDNDSANFLDLGDWDLYGFTNVVQTYFFGDTVFG